MMSFKVDRSSSSASGMAVAAKAARACDVCGLHRARWYCAADEAYICHPCDAKVHEANSLALRHSRVLLSPNNPPTHHKQQQHRHEHLQAAGDSAAGMMMNNSKISRRSNPAPNLTLFATGKTTPAAAAAAQRELSKTQAAGRTQSELLNIAKVKVKEEAVGAGDEYLIRGGKKRSNRQAAGVHEVPAFVSILPQFSSTNLLVTSDDHTQNHHVKKLRGAAAAAEEEEEEAVTDLFPRHFYFDATLGVPLKEDYPGGCTFLGEEIPGMDGYENSYNKYMQEPNSDPSSHKMKQEAVEEDLVAGGPYYPHVEAEGRLLTAKGSSCHVPSLKLNYKEVLSACSDQSLSWTAHDKHPQTVPDDSISDAAAAGNMDLGFVPDLNFGPQEIAATSLDDCYSGGGRREASLLRYKEKRHARLFSKKIRYEVRKLNAEQRPRMKGRFVKKTQWSTPEDGFGSY